MTMTLVEASINRKKSIHDLLVREYPTESTVVLTMALAMELGTMLSLSTDDDVQIERAIQAAIDIFRASAYRTRESIMKHKISKMQGDQK